MIARGVKARSAAVRVLLGHELWVATLLGGTGIAACSTDRELGQLAATSSTGTGGISASTTASSSSTAITGATATTGSSTSATSSSASSSSASSSSASSSSAASTSAVSSGASGSGGSGGGDCSGAGGGQMVGWEPPTCPDRIISTLALGYTNPCTSIVSGWQGTTMVGYTNGDLYRTFNGKASSPTWKRVDKWVDLLGASQGLPRSMVTTIAINPCNNVEAFVAFAGTTFGNKLFVTREGFSWTHIQNVPVGEIWGISYNPLNPMKLYVVGDSGNVAETIDGGATWSQTALADPLSPPLAQGERISAVSFVQNDPSHAVVGTTTGKVYLASGASWLTVSTALMPSRPIIRVTTNSNVQPPWLFVTYDGMFNDSVWMSQDGGQTWQNIHKPPLPTTMIPVSALALLGVSVNPVDNQLLYIDGTYGAGRSTNAGITWEWTSN